MNAYAFEDDELFEDDEDLDDAMGESDDLDNFLERRRRGRASRIRPGKTAKGTGLFKARPNDRYVTQAQLQAGLARVGKQIATNGEAIKKVTAQTNKVTSDLAAATTKISKDLKDVKKEVKQQAETALLMHLLQPKPELETKNPSANTGTAGAVVANVSFKQHSNLLPLILMMGSHGGGGMGGGDNNQMLFLALALSGQL